MRTVQRGITQARELGLLGTARARPDEVPPGCKSPIRCGWSHRWIVGWGLAVEACKAAVERARLKRMAKAKDIPAKKPRSPAQCRSWTPAELDAELERLSRPPD